MQASHRRGFSCCQSTDSRACGLSSGGSGLGSTGSVVAMGLSCSVASSNPVSPALTGRFLTTEPLEKSKGSFESTFPRGVGVRVTEGRSCVAEEAVGAPPPPPPSGQAHCSPSAGSLLFLLHIIIIIIIFLAAWHVGSYFSNQGSNPCPLQGKHRVLTTGQPREFLFSMFSASCGFQSFQCFQKSFLHSLVHACSVLLLIETHRLAPVISGFVSFASLTRS